MTTDITKRKPGRPPGAKNKQTLLAIAISEGLESLVVEEMPKVVEKAIAMAKLGDVPAMSLLMKYFMVTATDSQKSDQIGTALQNGEIAFNLTINVVGKDKECEGEVYDVTPTVEPLPSPGAATLAELPESPVNPQYLTPSVGV